MLRKDDLIYIFCLDLKLLVENKPSEIGLYGLIRTTKIVQLTGIELTTLFYQIGIYTYIYMYILYTPICLEVKIVQKWVNFCNFNKMIASLHALIQRVFDKAEYLNSHFCQV